VSVLGGRRRVLASATAAGLVVSVTMGVTPASAAQTIGVPTFGGPAVPQQPVGYNTGSMMQTIYNAESGGTDFWIDRLLARAGSDPSDPDGGILMTRGRAPFMKTHSPSVLGLRRHGRLHLRAWATPTRSPWLSRPAPAPSRRARRWQAPSYFRSLHTSGSIRVDNQGIDLPASWRLQYWNGSAYVDVAWAWATR
jgi:hypothetical protein